MMELFEPYSHALAAMALFGLIISVLTGVSAFATARERDKCGYPVRDYTDPAYRKSRAFLNAQEAVGPFLATTIAAIMVGASPFTVNLLASIFVVGRIATAVVHIMTENQNLRSLTWSVGFLSVIAMGITALIGAFG